MRPVNIDKQISYIQQLFTEQDDAILSEIENQLDDYKKTIQISSLEAKLLGMLIKMNNVRTIVELGCLAGYSAINMAKFLPDDGILYTIERDEHFFNIANSNIKNSSVANKIKIIHGDATIVLNENPVFNNIFDMVFIDANKNQYLTYLNWSKKHIKSGGLIVADDVMLMNSIYLDEPPENISPKMWSIMRQFNQELSNQNNFDSIILPIFEGILVAIKK